MPRLHIPVRYGSEIKDIEFTKFLELSDTVKPVLSLPVGIRTPVKDRGIAAGKLLRCDNNGVLLSSNQLAYTGVFSDDYSLEGYDDFVDIEFAETMHWLILDVSFYDRLDYLYWTDSGHTLILKNLGKGSMATIRFTGKKISIGAAFTDFGSIDFDIWAIY